MNIPYYRYCAYDDDGVGVYECLQCGEHISVRCEYKPIYCFHCGIKYEGEKPSKGYNKVYVNSYPYGMYRWGLERREKENDGSWSPWQLYKDNITYSNDIKESRKIAAKDLKEYRDIIETGRVEMRISRNLRVQQDSIPIRKKTYKERTGEDFFPRDYNKDLVYNVNWLDKYPSFLKFSQKINNRVKKWLSS